MSKTKQYEELTKKIRELQEEAQGLSKEMFSEAAADIFTRFPTLESFSWTQYTPYFNDGDACEFSVNSDYINLTFSGPIEGKKDDEDDDDYYDYAYEVWESSDKVKKGKTWDNKPVTPTELDHCVSAVGDLVQGMQEDDLFFMFGDHVRVVVNRNGTIDADEYSHD